MSRGALWAVLALLAALWTAYGAWETYSLWRDVWAALHPPQRLILG